MRNVKVYCLIVFAALTVFYACKSKEERNLVNHWKLTSSKNPLRDSLRFSLLVNTISIQNTLDTIKEGTQKQNLEQDLARKKGILHTNDSLFQLQVSNSFLEIKENGLYDCKLFDAKEAGTWKYTRNKNDQELVTNPVGGAEGKLKVLLVNKDSLIVGEDDNNCMVFIASADKK